MFRKVFNSIAYRQKHYISYIRSFLHRNFIAANAGLCNLLKSLINFFTVNLKIHCCYMPGTVAVKYAKTFLLLCLLTAGSLATFAQEATVKGSVTDSSGKVLEGATIALLSLPDSALVRQTRSIKNGFTLRRLSRGKYLVTATFVGFKKMIRPLVVSGNDTILQMAPFEMTVSAGADMMQVVVVSSIPPVISRSDTVAYQASAFKTRPDATVEELLKKLPGVQVSKDGEVTVNGQKVDKFYIDGKEIPLNDARAITRTLSADMISSLETFDRRSDDSKFTGVRDNDDAKAINFKLKKIYRSSITGKAFVGYGAPKYYGAGGNGLFSDSSTKAVLSVNRNNSSDVVSTNPSSRYNSAGGLSAFTRINLNGSKEFSAKLNVNGQYSLNNANVHNQRNDSRQTFLTDSSLLSTHANDSYNRNQGQYLGGRIFYKPDTTTEITFNPRVNWATSTNTSVDSQQVQVQKPSSIYLSSKSATITNTNSDNSGIGGDFYLRHRFHKKAETIRFHLVANQRWATDSGTFVANTLGYDSAQHIIYHQNLNQRYVQTSPAVNFGAGTGYTYPLTPSLILDATYDYFQNNQKSNKTTYNYDTLSGKYDRLDTLTTNRFANTLVTHKVSVGLNQTGTSFRYQMGLAVQHIDQQSNNLSGLQTSISQSAYNFFPRAGFFYAITPQQQLNFNYNGSTVVPSIDQLRPLPDFSNPLLIRKGNPDLKTEFDHNMNLNYRHFSVDKLRSLLVAVSVNLAQNKFTQSTILLPGGVQQLQSVNVDGTYYSNLSVNYNFPFDKGKKGNWRIGTNFSNNRNVGFINGSLNVQHACNINPNMSVNYSPIERLLIETDAQAWYNQTSNSFSGQQLNQFNQRYNIGFSYELPAGLLINTDIDMQITGPQGSLAGQVVNLWNANISKHIFPKKMGEIKLSAFDILNANKGFSSRLGDNFIETSNTLVMGHLLFVSFIYHFKVALAGG